MEVNEITTYVTCIFFLFILGKILMFPLIKIFKLLLNSVLGSALIYVINIIGNAFEFHIGLNIATAIFIGVLGLPGAILLVIAKLFLG